jgi:hypothetical protein
MLGKEVFEHFNKGPFENKSELQPVEPQLEQPKVAEEVHDIINGFRRGLKRTPKFFYAASDQILESQPGYIHYDIKDSHYVVLIQNKDSKIVDGRVVESLDFEKYTKDAKGEYQCEWSMYSWSRYVDDKPTRGTIRVQAGPINTASAVREAREFLRSEFGEPQAPTEIPPYK